MIRQMDEILKKQQEISDRSWSKMLSEGREQLGNLQANLSFLNNLACLTPGEKVLEIGCGIGTIVHELSLKGCEVTGIDISNYAVEYGRQKYPQIKLEVHPAESLPYEDGCFDVVLSFDLFEHIAEIDLHISEVWRVLGRGGYYLFQTPNKYSNVIFETLRTKSQHWRKFHPSLHTPAQLKRRLRRHGFEVGFVKMNTINEFTLNKIKKYKFLSFVMKHINFRYMPLFLQTNLYVIAQKPKGD